MKKIAMAIVVIVVLGLIGVTIYVEHEADYQLESLAQGGKAKALVLYHPSRDAHFSDDVSLALAEGLKSAGLSVDRATMTHTTPGTLKDYALVAVVSNTFWFTPDLPTLRYLARARLDGGVAIGLMLGSGSTERSQRLLEDALRKTGANVHGARSFWIKRPNDEARMNEDNRAVAVEMAKQFGRDTGASVLAATIKSSTATP